MNALSATGLRFFPGAWISEAGASSLRGCTGELTQYLYALALGKGVAELTVFLHLKVQKGYIWRGLASPFLPGAGSPFHWVHWLYSGNLEIMWVLEKLQL